MAIKTVTNKFITFDRFVSFRIEEDFMHGEKLQHFRETRIGRHNSNQLRNLCRHFRPFHHWIVIETYNKFAFVCQLNSSQIKFS